MVMVGVAVVRLLVFGSGPKECLGVDVKRLIQDDREIYW